ncbi:MAG: CDP-alcohol phosphatidyltransferase family protein [Ignavibacteria bacterium]|nr:CDP-alcohol phosphatidyltransferase family protein [Ignavibacteria bacterium]
MNLPNTLSLLRIVLSPVFLFLFLSKESLMIVLSFPVYSLAALTDWYDGWYARKYGFKTKWGRFIDPLADKILTSSAFIGFYFLEINYPDLFGTNKFLSLGFIVAIIIFRDIVLTAIRSVQELRGREFKTSFISKLKTFVQMIFIFLVIGLYSLSLLFPVIRDFADGFLYSEISYYLLLIVTLLTVLSGAAYFFESNTET